MRTIPSGAASEAERAADELAAAELVAEEAGALSAELLPGASAVAGAVEVARTPDDAVAGRLDGLSEAGDGCSQPLARAAASMLAHSDEARQNLMMLGA
jgi:hypothetical protein